MKALKYNPTEIDIDITDISLLTLKEIERLPEKIRRYDDWWWLRSPGGFPGCAAYVYSDGSVDDYGYDVDYDCIAVRPAITVSNIRFEIGDAIVIQGKKYVAIAPNKILYNDEVVCHRFDKESNEYEKSKIKKIVDGWFEREEEK